MPSLRGLSESLARRTTRRTLFSHGAQVATGALIGAAAGGLARAGTVAAGGLPTVCDMPGPPCPCDECNSTGVCAKPCVIVTVWYASGCWVTNGVTCCDCDCPDSGSTYCGCGSDYHNDPAYCP